MVSPCATTVVHNSYLHLKLYPLWSVPMRVFIRSIIASYLLSIASYLLSNVQCLFSGLRFIQTVFMKLSHYLAQPDLCKYWINDVFIKVLKENTKKSHLILLRSLRWWKYFSVLKNLFLSLIFHLKRKKKYLRHFVVLSLLSLWTKRVLSWRFFKNSFPKYFTIKENEQQQKKKSNVQYRD